MAMGVVAVTIVLTLSACKKLIEIDPPVNAEVGTEVYKKDNTAIAVLTGLYTRMSNEGFDGAFTGLRSVSIGAGLSADELTLVDDPNVGYYLPQLHANALTAESYGRGWSMFEVVYAANAAIEGLTNNTFLSVKVRDQLLGEAKFVRAYCYFYLTSLYGAVPLVLNTDYTATRALARTSQQDVFQAILTDLKEAEVLLSDDFMDAKLTTVTTERVRPTKWASTALLARCYLYLEQWGNAETAATKLLTNTARFDLVSSPDKVFLKNSKEAIWQLQPVVAEENTKEGLLFNLVPGAPNFYSQPVYLSRRVVDAFEKGDLRKVNWTNFLEVGSDTFYYPYKYKIGTTGQPVSEYLMVMRMSEQYLIRAEARMRQDKLADGIADVNALRTRARGEEPDDLPAIAVGISKDSALKVVLHERQVELFTEWGHRWLDLKRTGNVDAVMKVVTPTKGGTWQSYKQLYPIPAYDIILNNNLKPNNTGY